MKNTCFKLIHSVWQKQAQKDCWFLVDQLAIKSHQFWRYTGSTNSLQFMCRFYGTLFFIIWTNQLTLLVFCRFQIVHLHGRVIFRYPIVSPENMQRIIDTLLCGLKSQICRIIYSKSAQVICWQTTYYTILIILWLKQDNTILRPTRNVWLTFYKSIRNRSLKYSLC